MSKKEDPSLKRRLLSPGNNTDKSYIENEMESDNEEDLSLHEAVYDGEDFEEIKEKFEENPDLVFVKGDGKLTPLHTLAISGHEQASEIAKLFLGVEESSDGQTILNIERPSLLESVDSESFTALHYAARNCLPDLVESLLRYGAKTLVQNKIGNTPLHLAAEGNTKEALECVKIILKYDKDDTINSKNGEELCPLHMAVKQETVDMVKLLLQPEYKLNLSKHVKKANGQSILHFICLQPGEETNKLGEITRAILARCDKSFLNLGDDKERSALHTAAIERLPQFTEILVNNEHLDVTKLDSRSRTALHYAAENGSYLNGYRCVESLISHKFKDLNKKIDYLYKTTDDMNLTCFMYACINCPATTMQKYLAVIPEPEFWMTEASMTLVYKQSPLAITALMDRAFSEQKEKGFRSAEHDVIYADFGPITGYTDPVEILPQEPMHERKNRQETKYLKQALWYDFETQKEILMHPLVQLFIAKKCQKLKPIIYGWIAWQLVWLAAYTLLILSVYSKGIDSKAVAVGASFLMIIYAVISLLNEVYEVCSVRMAYLISLTNISQLLQAILTFIVVSPVFTGNETPEDWAKYAAAVGILLAYILSMRDIGRMHEEIGLVVEVLKQVVFQIIKVLLCCGALLVGFTLAFIVLFEDEESLNSTFPGPFVKVLVMMTGEFEYNDTFNNGEGSNNSKTTYTTVRLVFFLAFLIAVPVAFFNLLCGFALDKVMELRERAKIAKIAKQLEHVYFIDSILLSLSFLQRYGPHDKVVHWLRKCNVTTAIGSNGNLRFTTVIKEETQKKIEKRTLKRLGFWKCATPICSTELPADIRSDIFKLASASNFKESEDNCITVCKCNCRKCR